MAARRALAQAGRLRLLGAALGAVALIGVACTPGSDFPAPSDPVSTIPWPSYELLRYDVTDQTGEHLGTLELEVERQGDEYRMRVLFLLDDAEVRDETLVAVSAETLEPLRYERLAVDTDNRIEVSGVYGVDASATPFVDALKIENGERREQRVTTGEFSFDTDSSAWLWRSIAFALDYEVSYRSVNVFAQRSQLVSLRVRGQDLLRTPLGDILTWQVEARPGPERQSAWYAVDPPHVLVRWDLQPRRYLLREIVTVRPSD